MASDDDKKKNDLKCQQYQLTLVLYQLNPQFLTIGSHVCDKSGYKKVGPFFLGSDFCRGVEWATELQHFFPQSLGHQQWIFLDGVGAL